MKWAPILIICREIRIVTVGVWFYWDDISLNGLSYNEKGCYINYLKRKEYRNCGVWFIGMISLNGLSYSGDGACITPFITVSITTSSSSNMICILSLSYL